MLLWYQVTSRHISTKYPARPNEEIAGLNSWPSDPLLLFFQEVNSAVLSSVHAERSMESSLLHCLYTNWWDRIFLAIFLCQSQNRRKFVLTWAYSPEQGDSAVFCDVNIPGEK